MKEEEVTPSEIEELHATLSGEATAAGYNLNADADFVGDLVRGLLINERRYGYRACPCRLASGDAGQDLDIVCPCDYRDADLNDFGACYCALYVSEAVLKGEKTVGSIPERRPPPDKRRSKSAAAGEGPSSLPLPVWRCKVCGYLCAREQPPDLCPICKARKERFERFL